MNKQTVKQPLSWTEKKALKRQRLDAKVAKDNEKKIKSEPQAKNEVDRIPTTQSHSDGAGRHYTISMALPGSILENAQTRELRSYLAGQIARAAVVFNIDEIVIFDESGEGFNEEEGDSYSKKKSHGNVLMARILQFLECPQYLRKDFFPMHNDLKFAGLLNPLDSPHHMRASDRLKYREGVILDKVTESNRSYVNVGLYKNVTVDKKLEPGVRVTVKLNPKDYDKRELQGEVVSPSTPRLDLGLYWGYNLRLANNLSSVLTQCPYKGGYDLTIGTSERGDVVDEFLPPTFHHAIVVFGGVQGLEVSLAADKSLNVDDPSLLFNHYLNTCPNQGSRTIRTEEAILITMSVLRSKLISVGYHPV